MSELGIVRSGTSGGRIHDIIDTRGRAYAPSRQPLQGSRGPYRASTASASRPHNPQQHLPCAGFGPPHGGRTLARGAMHFARPYRDAVAHAERHEFEPKVTPIRFTSRTVEARLTIEAVEIGADELAVLYAKTSIVDEIGHAARGVDLIVRVVQGARFRLDNLDAVLDRFL